MSKSSKVSKPVIITISCVIAFVLVVVLAIVVLNVVSGSDKDSRGALEEQLSGAPIPSDCEKVSSPTYVAGTMSTQGTLDQDYECSSEYSAVRAEVLDDLAEQGYQPHPDFSSKETGNISEDDIWKVKNGYEVSYSFFITEDDVLKMNVFVSTR